MVLLHYSEKEIGVKSAMEGKYLGVFVVYSFILMFSTAIGICFQMTDVFRSEILAVVMQQIMDEPVLPVLFLRTVNLSTSRMRIIKLTCFFFFKGHSSR